MSRETLQNWQRVKFGEILRERNERALNDGKFPLYSLTIADGVSPKSARYEREFLVSNTETKTYKIVNNNDLVFNPANLRWGAIARAKIPFSVLVSPIYEILFPKDNNVLCPIFLEYLAKSDHLHLEYLHYMEGTLVERTALKIDKFLNLTVNIPPLPEQKKIASILTSVDEVIENTQKQIDKLQELKKATMNELLTKGIGHTEFKDSELGRIPKNWEVRLLSDVTVKIGDGIHATPKYSESGKYPFINGNNLENGRIVINNSTKTVDHLEFEKQRTDLGQKTLLISINGTIGNLAFYNGEEVVLGKSAAYLTFLDNVNLSYAYYLLGSEPLRKHFHDELTGTTIKNLSLKSIRNTPIPTPPISEQIEISSVVTSIDKKITAHQQKLAQTQSLKKSLMQDLLTGKVRV